MATKRTLEKRLEALLAGASLKETFLPLVPEIRLYLLDDDYPQGVLSTAEIKRLMDEPFFWPFCWPAGQILARWLYDNRESVAGKRILDFGAGSGVVAIAAALCGAGEAAAFDSDPLACEAMRANAALNRISLRTEERLAELGEDYDLVLAADVLYDHNNFYLLEYLAGLGKQVIIADSRVKELPFPYRKIAEQAAATLPDLGDPGEYRPVSIFSSPL